MQNKLASQINKLNKCKNKDDPKHTHHQVASGAAAAALRSPSLQ
jgi:hypothetical protein